MKVKEFSTCRLVKGQDLNHHGTLFAGRGAEWFVESGFIAAAAITCPDNVVCAKIHGMAFTMPVRKGHIIRFTAKVVDVGRTKLVSYVKVTEPNSETIVVEGFLTFVHVDANGKPAPHGIDSIEFETEEDRVLQEIARQL